MRRLLAVVLTLVGCLLSILSLVAVWARAEVLDTDRYVASVRPLASDPVIQSEVADRVSRALLSRLDVDSLPLAVRLVVRQAVRSQAAAFVDRPAFASLWVQTNRRLHGQVLSVLRGGDGGEVTVRSGELRLDLTDVADAVRAQVAAEAPAGLATLPRVTPVLDLADARQVEEARTAVTWLDRLALVLPVLTVLLLGAAVLTSRRRVRAGGLVLLSLALALVVARLLLRAGQAAAESRLPDRVASDAAVGAFYVQVTSLLRDSVTVIGGVACVAGLVALVVSLVVGRPQARLQAR